MSAEKLESAGAFRQSQMAAYKVQFEVYEGPLDLLLYLVRKQEVDIYQVNLARLAAEFIQYIEQMREWDIHVAGEFVVMAATLMHIKSRELLPKEKQDKSQEEDEDEDPRWELIRQLVEYKKFKDAAGRLQGFETAQENIFPRNPGKPQLPPVESAEQNPQVTVFDLLQAVNDVLARVQEQEADARAIHADPFTVSEKIQLIRETVLQKKRIRFTELFADSRSRPEIVCTFLAMLELIRLRLIQAVQRKPFGEIELEQCADSENTEDVKEKTPANSPTPQLEKQPA